MFYIVEDESQIQLLVNSQLKECYIEVVTTGFETHPELSQPSLIYIRSFEDSQGYIIPVDHSEGINVNFNRVLEVIQSIDTLYTLDKKFLLYFIKHPKIIDVGLLYSLNEYKVLEELPNPKIIQQLHQRNPNYVELNRLIPISIQFSRCEDNFMRTQKIVNRYRKFLNDPSWEFHNKDLIGVFYLIEKNGIHVRRKEFLQDLNTGIAEKFLTGDTVFSYYKLNNITGRPSNSFNGFNFLAIPKTEIRRNIVPGNDLLMEVDFDGYHIRILGELLGHNFTEESIHTQLGRLYFNKQNLTKEEYKQSKQKTFQCLYSGRIQEVVHIDFFKKVYDYSESLWKEFTYKGEIRVPRSNKIFTQDTPDLNQQKLLSYVIQNLETFRNVSILKQVLKLLHNRKSKIILNVYDALLFDIDSEENNILLPSLIESITENGKYPVKIKYGKDYFFD